MRAIWFALFFLFCSSPLLADSHGSEAPSSSEDDDESSEKEDEGDTADQGAGDDSGSESAADVEDEATVETTGGESSDVGAPAPEAAAPAPEAAAEASEVESPEPADSAQTSSPSEPATLSKLPALLTSREPVALKLPGDITIRPIARVQARITVFDEDDAERNDPVVYGDPGLREGVSLRRVRLGMEADWKGLLGLSIVGGFDNRYDYTETFGGGFSLTEATFSLTPQKQVGLTVGLDRVAFGRQATTSSASLALAERSIASEHMAPDREAGVFLAGRFGPEDNKVLGESAVAWAFGVSNGGGDWSGDSDPSPRLAGRVSLDLGAPWEQVESDWALGGFGLSVGGSLSHNWGLEADTLLAGVDLGLRVGRLGLQGEFMVGHAVPTFDTEGIPSLLAERTSLGGYGQVVVAILPGILEAAARVGGYDDNAALDDAGDRLDIAGGVNLYLPGGRLKAQLDFVHRIELVESYVTSNDSLILQIQARL